MALLYLMDHVAASVAGNYYVKMVFCYSTKNFKSKKMYHTCIDLPLIIYRLCHGTLTLGGRSPWH